MHSNEKKRVFIAIPINYRLQEDIAEAQELLKAVDKKANYTELGNFHVTLYFIGETLESELNLFVTAITNVAAKTAPFDISFTERESFRRGIKQIPYLGLKDTNEPLNKMREDLLNELKTLGWNIKGESAYKPHITMGRNFKYHHEVSKIARKWPALKINWLVENISLMVSEREYGILYYTELYTARLLGK